MPFLATVLKWAMGSFIARVVYGAGMAVATYSILSILIVNALELAASYMTNPVFVIAHMAGLGEVLSIIGSALLTRANILAGMVYVARAQSSA